jgi:hypothetical protein
LHDSENIIEECRGHLQTILRLERSITKSMEKAERIVGLCKDHMQLILRYEQTLDAHKEETYRDDVVCDCDNSDDEVFSIV